MEPTFSVIIPTYGRPAFLHAAVQSVLDQTVPDFECLVIDDASPTPVQAPADPRVRVIRRDANGGPAAARNTGMEHARGRYITFLDDDDLYARGRLHLALIGLRRANVAICHARYLDQPFGRNRIIEGWARDTILDDITPHAGATALAREALIPFDESFDACEDVDWWLRLAQRHPVATEPTIGVLIRRHGDPRHRTGTASRLAGNDMLFAKHAGYFAAHPRAHAFRLKRDGHLALLANDRARARSSFAASFRLAREPRTLVGLGRAVAPTR